MEAHIALWKNLLTVATSLAESGGINLIQSKLQVKLGSTFSAKMLDNSQYLEPVLFLRVFFSIAIVFFQSLELAWILFE